MRKGSSAKQKNKSSRHSTKSTESLRGVSSRNPQVQLKNSLDKKLIDSVTVDSSERQEEPEISVEISNNTDLFRYTSTPIENASCCFLLYTKKIIYDEFMHIQQLAEKFYMVEMKNQSKESKDCSPEKDFRNFTNNIVKRLRVLNIECEQAWILIVHDALCLLRAMQGITEDRILQDFLSIKEKWKCVMSRLCCESDVALEEAVLHKCYQALEMCDKHELVSCCRDEQVSISRDVENHCYQHVNDIKNIWAQFTSEMKDKYSVFRTDLNEFSNKSLQLRNALIENDVITTFLVGIKKFSLRYNNRSKALLDSYNEDEIETDSENNEDGSEIGKVKRLRFLTMLILTLIENIEANSDKELEHERKFSSQSLMFPEVATTNKMDFLQERNLLLEEIVKTMKGKVRCFKEMCCDQIGATEAWLAQTRNCLI